MDLVSYLVLFPSYTRDLPRFSALAEVVLRQATDLIALIPNLESGFSVDGAAGAQLDALGASFFTPRQRGWDDETYRNVLRRKLKRVSWDGRNGTVSEFLSDGDWNRIDYAKDHVIEVVTAKGSLDYSIDGDMFVVTPKTQEDTENVEN